LDYKFIVKERNECVPLCNKEHLCIHIEAIHLIDGTYKLVPTHENESHDGHVLSVETHRRAATGNTKGWEVAGALAGTAPSSTARNSVTRLENV